MLPTLGPLTLPLALTDEPPRALRLSIDDSRVRELADSLARDGQLQRIRVHHHEPTGRFVICAGHRRYLAARFLAWTTIQAEAVPWCRDCTTAGLAENIQRADLTPLEEAHALDQLRRAGHDPAALTSIVRRSAEWVHNRLALLDYPDDLKDAIHTHGLPLAVAACLVRIDHEPYRAYLTRDALAHGASARTVDAWVQHYQAERVRIQANSDTVEQIAAARQDYVILAPCDYCGDKEPLERTRSWRLCSSCTAQLRAVVAAHRPD